MEFGSRHWQPSQRWVAPPKHSWNRFLMLRRGICRQSFSECKILQNLWPAQYIMPLTPSILFPNTNQHTPTLRLPPLQASIQPERGEEIGPVAKAVFSAPAPARSIWDTQQAEVSLFRWHFGQYLLIDGRKREKKNRRGIIREGWEQQRHFVFLFPS